MDDVSSNVTVAPFGSTFTTEAESDADFLRLSSVIVFRVLVVEAAEDVKEKVPNIDRKMHKRSITLRHDDKYKFLLFLNIQALLSTTYFYAYNFTLKAYTIQLTVLYFLQVIYVTLGYK